MKDTIVLKFQMTMENAKTQTYMFWAFTVGFIALIAISAACIGIERGNWAIGQDVSTLMSVEFAEQIGNYGLGLLVSVLWYTNKGKVARKSLVNVAIIGAGFLLPQIAFYGAYLAATVTRFGHAEYFANSLIAVCLLTALVAGTVGFLLGQRKAAVKPNQSRKPVVKATE